MKKSIWAKNSTIIVEAFHFIILLEKNAYSNSIYVEALFLSHHYVTSLSLHVYSKLMRDNP